jgi:hypothetical protein
MIPNQPPYGIAGQDLSTMWLDLVQRGKVSATIPITSNNAPGSSSGGGGGDETTVMVNFGIRMVGQQYTEGGKGSVLGMKCEEYVVQEGLKEGEISNNPIIREINATLSKLSMYNQDEIDHPSCPSPVVLSQRAGAFVAQLQLVRTLRPPPSAGFSEATTSIPPVYKPEIDSFVTGPLRLELRPRVCRLELTDNQSHHHLFTPWDVYHNVSPADIRGHFLLVPTLSNREENWRGQTLTANDCNDLVLLASTIEPAGSLLLGYNSVGAGASQNHIHCHAWPCPPTPLLVLSKDDEKVVVGESTNVDQNSLSDKHNDDDNDVMGWSSYPASNVESMYDFYDVEKMGDDPNMIGRVEVSYLKYPIFCIQLSASTAHLPLLGKAVASCLEAIGDAPHNLSFLNRVYQPIDDDDHHHDENDNDNDGTNDVDQNDGSDTVVGFDDNVDDDDGRVCDDDENVNDEQFVDVYVFARSKERSDCLPSLKLGVSEMMGVFHAQSQEELQILSSYEDVEVDGNDSDGRTISVMEKCLADVSYENEENLWNKIKEKLSSL